MIDFWLLFVSATAFALPYIEQQGHREDQAILFASPFQRVHSYAAVGDSYAAGIGAGRRYGGLGAYFCSRYDASYPSVIESSIRNDPDKTTPDDDLIFTHLACSGADTLSITDAQLRRLEDRSQDLITISAGANDAHFIDILNACIYRWLGPILPVDCDIPLQMAHEIIASRSFAERLDDLLVVAHGKLSPSGRIYQTGYPEFFGEQDEICNDVAWNIWHDFDRPLFLTLERRRRMNYLSRKMNQAIQSAVYRSTKRGGRVTFVNYDAFVRLNKGGFCEKGVVEPRPQRPELLFYEIGTQDVSTASLVQNDKNPDLPPLSMNGTFEGRINAMMSAAMSIDPPLSFRNSNGFEGLAELLQANSESRLIIGSGFELVRYNATDEQLMHGFASYFIPDVFGRVFHPRPGGHRMIASIVLSHMQQMHRDDLATAGISFSSIGLQGLRHRILAWPTSMMRWSVFNLIHLMQSFVMLTKDGM